MPAEKDPRQLRIARHHRVRRRVQGTADRPRLCVFRSLKYIYVQIVDDSRGSTLVAASSLEPELRKSAGKLPKTQWSKVVGGAIAQRALEKGITKVVFDRGGYQYHGRVKQLAEAAREGGLVF